MKLRNSRLDIDAVGVKRTITAMQKPIHKEDKSVVSLKRNIKSETEGISIDTVPVSC